MYVNWCRIEYWRLNWDDVQVRAWDVDKRFYSTTQFTFSTNSNIDCAEQVLVVDLKKGETVVANYTHHIFVDIGSKSCQISTMTPGAFEDIY